MNNSTLNTSAVSTNSISPSLSSMQILEICVHCISFLVGFPLHSCIIWLVLTETSGVASEFFHLNLSFSEAGNCLNSFFAVLTFWFSGLLLLKLFLTGLTIMGRPIFQCLICVERYLAVVHPVTFLKSKPLRYRVICCIVAWILTFGTCLSCMYITENIVLYMWFFSVHFLIFLAIQLFCLVAVLRVLKQSGPGERGKKREEENQKRRKAFHLILISTMNMVVTYLPLCLTGLYTIVSKLAIEVVWLPAVICYILAGFVHPVLYLRRTGKLSCF